MNPDFGDMTACEAHIEWCDMPRSLLAQWANEYLRKKAEPEAGFATGAGDDGAAESRPGAVFLFISSR
jgi:hypothetical protein